jgi:hypothetical protein
MVRRPLLLQSELVATADEVDAMDVRMDRHQKSSIRNILAHVEEILHQCLPVFASDLQDLV